MNNVYSAAGSRVGGNERPRQTAKKEYYGIHKHFTGFKAIPKERQTIIESVDFDNNGKIDFTDFTIFSSVYGQNLNNPTAGLNEDIVPEKPEFETTPLNNDSNATRPDTSLPGASLDTTEPLGVAQ